MIPLWNNLTSEQVVPNMPESEIGTGGRPDALNVMANLWQLMHSLIDESAPALDSIGLSPKAFFLLSMVEEIPFPAEIARAMHLPPPTVSYLVKQLEALKLIGRKPEPGDLRKLRLVLTPAGRKAIRRGKEAIGRVFGRRLERIDATDVSDLDRIVSALNRGA